MPNSRAFPTVSREITREMVALYGKVNGDRNLIHYDDAVAQAAGFPRAIAHGAMTAAVISEACREFFGPAWIDGGRLNVKFIGPLLVGDTVSAHGEVTAREPARSAGSGQASDGERVTVNVWCESAGEKILVGEAIGVLRE